MTFSSKNRMNKINYNYLIYLKISFHSLFLFKKHIMINKFNFNNYNIPANCFIFSNLSFSKKYIY